MHFLYNIALYIYYAFLSLISPFNKRARQFTQGRRGLIKNLQSKDSSGQWIWFHCASLGEFEQARPLIESIKSQRTNCKVLLTFYSPSGYEVRRDYKQADLVTYLPFDTPKNAQTFIQLFDIKLAGFVKYEFWLNYLTELNERHIPVISVSSIFRKHQLFFRPFGGFYRGFLKRFNYLMVQDQASVELLKSIGITNVSLTSDTRFDRVYQLAKNPKSINQVQEFKGSQSVIVFGSVWPSDMRIIAPILDDLMSLELRVIIAPHQIEASFLNEVIQSLSNPYQLHSNMVTDRDSQSILIIDSIGLLSSIYQYANIAYVGGAFNGTLHNILEPSTYGIPVLFGDHPTNQKFKEATDLCELGGAKPIKSSQQLLDEIELLMQNTSIMQKRGNVCRNYVEENTGATDKIMELISAYL